MTTARNPIVVRCNHGISGSAAEFVQRYRYDVSMGRWNPTDYSAEGGTYTPNKPGDPPHHHVPPLFDDDSEPINLSREHFNARCKRCRMAVSMRADRAQSALTRLSDAGLTDVSLVGLQRAYDSA